MKTIIGVVFLYYVNPGTQIKTGKYMYFGLELHVVLHRGYQKNKIILPQHVTGRVGKSI